METNQFKLPNIHHAKNGDNSGVFKSTNALSKSLDSLKSLESFADVANFTSSVKK